MIIKPGAIAIGANHRIKAKAPECIAIIRSNHSRRHSTRPVKRVDILFAESGSVGKMHRFVRASSLSLDRNR